MVSLESMHRGKDVDKIKTTEENRAKKKLSYRGAVTGVAHMMCKYQLKPGFLFIKQLTAGDFHQSCPCVTAIRSSVTLRTMVPEPHSHFFHQVPFSL